MDVSLNHLEFGALGERLAAEHIEGIGWRIIDRNVRVGRGELDIIAVDGDELVIIEVRTRRIGILSPSETTVGPNKLKSILKTARKYVEGKLSYEGNWRIDIAAVTLDENGAYRVEMFSDITMGMEGGYMKCVIVYCFIKLIAINKNRFKLVVGALYDDSASFYIVLCFSVCYNNFETQVKRRIWGGAPR